MTRVTIRIVAAFTLLAAAPAFAPPIMFAVPRYPLAVTCKSSQLPEALRSLRQNQTLTVVGGGAVQIPEYLTLRGLIGVRIVAEDAVTITGGQLTLIDCQRVTLENFRFYPNADRSPQQIAAYIERTRGLDGRALVVNNCRTVTVRHCTFAACTDDMAGVSGDSDNVVYDRCLFAMPLGIYGQAFLGWTSATEIRHIPNWLTLTRCVFAGWYRCPKLVGGEFLVDACVMAGMHYRPLELNQPRGTFTRNWFYPMKGCDARPILLGTASAGLSLAGNRLFGRPAGWNELVGLPSRGPSDKQNIVHRTAIDHDSSDEFPESPSMTEIVSAAGTRGPADEIESAARWYVRLMAE